MISGVGASLGTRMVLEPLEDFAVRRSTTYSKPLVTGTGGFKITDQAAGRVAFDLNDGYSMWIDESRSAFTVANAGKETVHVWGAAQLALDGTTLGGFAGTTSLVLGNGTKITMGTLPETKSADIFYLDHLTVTQGDQAMIVSGVSQEKGGDLVVTQSRKGYAIDEETRDGLVFEQVAPNSKSVLPEPSAPPASPVPETNSLTGWADEYGIAVTPEMLAVTRPGGDLGPGSETMSRSEFHAVIMRFLSWGQTSSLMSWSTQSLNSELRRQDPADVARSADIRRAWARHADEAAAATRGAIRNSEIRSLAFSS